MVGTRNRTSAFSSGSISEGCPKFVRSPARTSTSAWSRAFVSCSCSGAWLAGEKCKSAVAAILIRQPSAELPCAVFGPVPERAQSSSPCPLFTQNVLESPLLHIDGKRRVVDESASKTASRIRKLHLFGKPPQKVL